MEEDTTSGGAPFGAWSKRWLLSQRWMVALIAATVGVVIALVVATAAIIHPAGAVAHLAPTATATQTALPTPTVQPGFRYYTEAASDFQIQYPLTWQSVPQNPGVEMDDSMATPTYIMQVLLPTQNLDIQTDWLQYEFNNLKQTTGTSDFMQIGSRALVSVNGIEWTSALARLQQATTTITVRVLVTTHHDRVYIINMLAANVTMDVAQQQYFNAMLGTFTFLS